MRKHGIVKIDDKEITVWELKITDWLEIVEKGKTMPLSVDSVMDLVQEHIGKLTSLKLEELKAFAPSEIRVIVDKVKEINSDFFELAQWMGIPETLKGMKNLLIQDSYKLFSDALKKVT